MTASVEVARPTSRFAALDTLRAVGALAVLTTHVGFWAGDYTGNGVWGTVLARFDVGVAIFFVLSGFLLSRPWLEAAATSRAAPRSGRYLWHRLVRIAPLYVVTVVLALALIGDNRVLGVRDWWITLLMLDTFLQPSLPHGLTHMWSLAVEVTFYLVLPLLMVLALGRRPRLSTGRVLTVLTVLTGVSVLWQLLGVPALEGQVPGQPAQWLPGYLAWFSAGVLVALVHTCHHQGTPPRWVSALVTLGAQPGACWSAAGGLLLLSATPLAGPSMLASSTPAEALFKHLVYAVIGLLLVLTCVFAPRGGFRTVFEAPVPRHLGTISYGVFCLHLPVLHLVMWATGWQLFDTGLVSLWVCTLAVSLVVAELAHRLVERPATRLRDLGQRGRRAEPASHSTPTTGTSAR